MKKLIICLLIAALCLVMFACSDSGAAATIDTQPAPTEPLPPLQVGYGRRDISPDEGVPLQGYSNSSERLSNGIITERLYATCVAFTDNTNKTVLLFHLDLTTIAANVFDPIREKIAERTGVPFEQILLAATHNHSSPDVKNLLARKYVEKLEAAILEAADEAMADRQEASISVAEAYAENLNWVRYYNYSDGTWGSGTLPAGAKRVSHIREETDNQLQMIRFVRQDTKDVYLVNWQGHPHREGSDDSLVATSDIVGAMRRILEEQDDDVLFAYFSGASGNLNNHSMIPGVTTTKDQDEHGAALVKYMTEAQFTPAEAAPIQLIYRIEKLTSQGDNTKQMDFPICAFSIGDVAFVTAPYEMFDTNGQAIKENSKFETTFVITYANAHNGYLPSLDAFEADSSYEVRITKVIKGSAEQMVGAFTEMLDQIYTQGNP